MTSTFESGNKTYVDAFGDKGSMGLAPPAKKLIVVTCMDARIDPAAALGLKEGDAHIIRNAGGRVQDSLRSILISQRLLATSEIAVIHHSDCGMLTFTSPVLHSKLKQAHPEHASEIEKIDFLTFSELEPSVKEDVAFLKAHPLVLKDSSVSGWVYDVKTGKVTKVV